MKVKKTTTKAVLAGAFGAAAVGLSAGIAQADPPMPAPPVPGISVDGPHVSGPGVDLAGPGVNIDGPGTPAPPGQGYLAPPGHADQLSVDVPSWAPPPPWWAPFAPVQWNAQAQAWGVYVNGGFQAL